MSSAPAYRYDHAATRPARHLESAPSVRVVPGRKHAVYPTLSDGAVLGIKAIIACVIVFLVIGFVRVGLSSAAYSIASQSSDLRAQISDARTTGESLAVQESLLSNPNNIRTEAGERLSMTAATNSSTMTLSVDPVAIDSAGNLSFSESVLPLRDKRLWTIGPLRAAPSAKARLLDLNASGLPCAPSVVVAACIWIWTY